MVDIKLAYRNYEPLRRIGIPKFYGGVIDTPTEEDGAETQEINNDGVGIFFDDLGGDRERWTKWSSQTDLLEKRSPGTLSAECHSLLPARVWGYVFLRRKWCKSFLYTGKNRES